MVKSFESDSNKEEGKREKIAESHFLLFFLSSQMLGTSEQFFRQKIRWLWGSCDWHQQSTCQLSIPQKQKIPPKIGFEWMKFSSILHFAFPWKDSKEAIKGYHHFLLSLSFNGWCRTHSTRKTFLISEAYQGPNLTSHCLIFLSLLRLHAPFHFQPFLFDLSRHVTRNTAAPSSQITFCLTFYR